MGGKEVEHHEPISISVLENFLEFNACKEKFEGTWYQFFQKFKGYEDEITLYFAQGFDGKVVHIGNFIMTVSEKTISCASGLPCCNVPKVEPHCKPCSKRNCNYVL